MTTLSREQLAARAAMTFTTAIGEAIRDIGNVPAGHLYAAVCSVMDINMFNAIIAKLEEAGLVKRNGHLLSWIGPSSS